MCGLCGVLGGGPHWTEDPTSRSTYRAAAQRRAALADRVLRASGVRVATWGGGRMTVRGATGGGAVVDDLAALWPTAEGLAKRRLDPLDPTFLDRLVGQ